MEVDRRMADEKSATQQPSRAHKKYGHRHDKFLEEINYDAIIDAHQQARDGFKAAQLVYAKVKVRDLAELCSRHARSSSNEDTRQPRLRHAEPLVAASVTIDLAAMNCPEKACVAIDAAFAMARRWPS